MASPAIDGRALYLRTKTHLYRIENARAPYFVALLTRQIVSSRRR